MDRTRVILIIYGRNKVNITKLLGVVVAASMALFPLGCSSKQPSESPEPINIIKPVPEETTFKNFLPRSALSYSGLQRNSYSKTGWDSWANISLDGRYMAFSSTAQTGNPDIYVKTVSGTAVSQKTTSTATDIQP